MHLLVLGATSDIAKETARLFAKAEGANVYLAGRDLAALELLARDIETRYSVKAAAVAFDATDFASHAAFYAALDPKPDVVLLAFGLLGDQKESEGDFAKARHVIDVNFTGAASILEIVAADMEAKGRGSIIGVSSVAGLRGRKSNYVYGAAKAALTAYLSGLRHRLQARGARVMTVLPGFVRTRMTEGLPLPAALTANPDEVARAIHAAWRGGKDVVYAKWFWRYIMLIIRHLPEPIFKRTNL